MAKENSGQAVRDYKSRKKRVKRIRTIVVLTLLVVLAVGGAVYLYSLYNKSYKGCEVVSSSDIVANGTANFIKYQSAVIRYSRDGAEAIDKDGKQMWNGSYEMDKPIVDTCGKYAVVADQGGKSIEIFDDKGRVGQITTVYSIIKVRIASQGVVAVLMESDRMNYITFYDKDGTVLKEIATDMQKDGYPIDIALSMDGQKLVTDYLSVNNGKMVGIITFYNFGEVGQNWTDGIMGAYTFDGIVIPRVAFNNNDAVCAYKDNGIMIFEYKEQPKVVLEQNFEEKITSVLYNKNHAGAILDEGDGGSSKLVLYDLQGNECLERRIDFNFSHIEMTEEEIIMNDSMSCIIMRPDGRIKFKYTFDTGITSLIPINHLDRYILVSDKKISQIVLTE